jgi:hypothetical protein
MERRLRFALWKAVDRTVSHIVIRYLSIRELRQLSIPDPAIWQLVELATGTCKTKDLTAKLSLR